MRTVYRAAGGSGPLALTASEQPMPEPSGDQLVVAIEAVAITAADCDAAADPQTTPGQSGVGRVTATGDASTDLLNARVALTALSPCGECDRCRRGVVSACPELARLGVNADGTLASHVVTRARWAMPIDDEGGDGALALTDDVAAVLGGEALAVYAAYCRAGVTPGTPVVVIGGGVGAAIASQLGRALGTEPIDASNAAPADAAVRGKPWSVLITRTPADDDAWLDAIEPGSTVSVCGGATLAAAPDLVARGCRVLGDVGAHPDLMPELAALAARAELDLSTVVAREDRSVTIDRARELIAGDRIVVVPAIA